MTLPPLATAAASAPAPVPKAESWTWLNLWATWCVPCVAEMGLLERWQERLKEAGVPVDFWLLSLDADDAAPRRFLAGRKQPLTGPTLRAASIEAVNPWLQGLGLADGAAIPIQVLVAPGGEVRCVRVGAVSEGDFRLVRELFAGR